MLLIGHLSFLFIQAFVILSQILLTEYGELHVECWPLGINEHLLCGAIGFGSIFVGILGKRNLNSKSKIEEKFLSEIELEEKISFN